MLANPPYGSATTTTPESLRDHLVLAALSAKVSRRGEVLHLAAGLALLTPGGRLGIVASERLLANDRDLPVRRALLDELAAVEAVVSLPPERGSPRRARTPRRVSSCSPRRPRTPVPRSRWLHASGSDRPRGHRAPCDLDGLERNVGNMLVVERARRAHARKDADAAQRA